jgi:hypothetical protein
MKYPNLIGLLFTLFTVTTNAQSSTGLKPKIFASFPATVLCSEQELSKAFSTAVDQNISLSFSNNLLLNGTVTGNIVKYSNLQSVTIKLPEFDNVIFSISKITNGDKSITYVGRIINKKYADGYELKKDASNTYQFVKFETDKLIPDCSQ